MSKCSQLSKGNIIQEELYTKIQTIYFKSGDLIAALQAQTELPTELFGLPRRETDS